MEKLSPQESEKLSPQESEKLSPRESEKLSPHADPPSNLMPCDAWEEEEEKIGEGEQK